MVLTVGLTLLKLWFRPSKPLQLNTHVLYDNNLSVEEKIEKIVTEIYRGTKVNFEKKAKTQIDQIVKNGWDKLPTLYGQNPIQLLRQSKCLGSS